MGDALPRLERDAPNPVRGRRGGRPTDAARASRHGLLGEHRSAGFAHRRGAHPAGGGPATAAAHRRDGRARTVPAIGSERCVILPRAAAHHRQGALSGRDAAASSHGRRQIRPNAVDRPGLGGGGPAIAAAHRCGAHPADGGPATPAFRHGTRRRPGRSPIGRRLRQGCETLHPQSVRRPRLDQWPHHGRRPHHGGCVRPPCRGSLGRLRSRGRLWLHRNRVAEMS